MGWNKYIYLIGWYQIGYLGYHTGSNYYNQHYLQPSYQHRIQKVYNASGKQWAVVTGASEGIGRCYALDLARSGFNIVLASRSQEKLEKVQREIAGINHNLKVKVLPIDLASSTDYSAITADKEVSDNLAIVVNNAGQLLEGRFLELAPEQLQTELTLNTHAVTLLSKYARNAFAKQFDNSTHPEQEKFGLINLSSVASVSPVPGMVQYAATKVYDDQLSKSIRDSCSKRSIDTLVVHPGIVTTAMTNNAHIAGTTCLPEETSRGSLAQLGLLNHTYGSTIHSIFALECHAVCRPFEHQFKMWIGAKYKRGLYDLYREWGLMK